MLYLGIAIGIVVGAGGYYLYDRFFSKVYSLGKSAYDRARGDVEKARMHIAKLV